jgi:hypothetical protein
MTWKWIPATSPTPARPASAPEIAAVAMITAAMLRPP